MLAAKASLRRHLPAWLRRRQRQSVEKSLVNPHLTPSCTRETLEKTVAELPITQSWNHDPQGSHFFPYAKACPSDFRQRDLLLKLSTRPTGLHASLCDMQPSRLGSQLELNLPLAIRLRVLATHRPSCELPPHQQ
jgi:hypothetical protein